MKIALTHTPQVAKELMRLAQEQEDIVNAERNRLCEMLYDSPAFIASVVLTQADALKRADFDGMTTAARYRNSMHRESVLAIMGEEWCSLLYIAAQNGISLTALLSMSATQGDAQAKNYLAMLMNSSATSTNNGNAYACFFPLYHQYANAELLHIETSLLQALQAETHFPVGTMRDLVPSTPHAHVQFGTPGSQSVITDHIVTNEESGEHRLESCLISFHNANYRTASDEEVEARGLNPQGDIRSFDVMFVGTPKGTMMNDATAHISIVFDHDSADSIEEVICRNLQFYVHQAYPPGSRYQRLQQCHGEDMSDNLRLLAHCLKFLNGATCQRIAIDERGPLIEQWHRASDKESHERLGAQLEYADTYHLIKHR